MTDVALIAGWCFSASLFLPLFAWALMPLLPRCAATRHLVWLALFGVLLVLPLLALIVPPQIVLPQATDAAPSLPMAAAAPRGWSWTDALPFLTAAWLLGTGLHLARLGLGLFGLHRLCRDSVPFEDMRDVRLADDGPLAFGWIRPLILLPHAAAHWPQSRLDAVLAHERAHLKRRDCLSQLLSQVVCAFYWPNLLLWLAARSMRREAEIAADNAVLAGGMRASDYAAELLQLAGQTLRLPAVAMAAPSLEAQVKSVLSPAPSRDGVRVLDAFKIVWLGSAAAMALAVMRPAIAQQQEDAAAPPVTPHVVAAASPQVPPAPDAPATSPTRPVHHHHHIAVKLDGDTLTPDEQARIDAAVAQVRDSMAGIRPQVERAAMEARADRQTMQAVQQAMPQVHAAIAQAMTQIKPALHQAFTDERVDAKASAALERAEAQINIAMNHASQSGRGPHIAIRLWLFGPTTPPDPADP
ncbi:MAG TPA: M56 family metallopeptidase [Rhizomicrobium sp.]|jgi:hypothetical protein|nr:M56 family metallopeptidase [Rhizomicrobium sp.]